MEDAITAIAELEEVELVCQSFLQSAQRFGPWGASYHLTPPFARQTSPNIQMCSTGAPDSWKSLYRDPAFRSMDPIPDHIVEAGCTKTFQAAIAEIRESGDATDENERYFSAMAEHGFVHGVGIPLYGPHRRNGFAAFAFDEPVEVKSSRVAALEALSKAAHHRVAELLDGSERRAIKLSNREHEVLEQIAAGCSNVEIAARLGISPETVGTYVKRLFDKLDTRDRIGATVKGLKMGLIYA
jgi:DNA-binding CsgD family transcriptional regulator